MSRVMALLSGKGGSGKTTLALSIATMLSDAGLRVLLVDCDMNTNGATYFYEDKLSQGWSSSLTALLVDKKEEDDSYRRTHFVQYLTISEKMDFLPSIGSVSQKKAVSYRYSSKDLSVFESIIFEQRHEYDVIIYDCQAGYADILRGLLPFVDTNLIVMEADAISSSSIRNLFLKIGGYFGRKKVYQVFNKVPEEEYGTYSNITGGVTFTNIETITYDPKIRKAFAVAQVPDLATTSSKYGERIYNICKMLLEEKEHLRRLDEYYTTIEFNSCKELIEELEEKAYEVELQRKREWSALLRRSYLITMPIVMMSFLLIYYMLISAKSYKTTESFVMILFATASMILTFVSLAIDTRDQRDKLTVKRDIQRQLEEAKEKKRQLMLDLAIADVVNDRNQVNREDN